MSHARRLTAPTVVAALLVGGCGTSNAVGVDPTVHERFQAALDELSGAHGVIGAQAAVMIPARASWVGTYGRSGETSSMEAEMAVPVGSTSKTVISGLILHLVEGGALGLEDSVGGFLAPFPNVAPEVTVRQLLQNTSGIASFSSAPGFVDSLTADRSRVWSPEEVMTRFVGEPEFGPGTSWKSSNTGYVLAAMIAEAVTGRTLAELYADELYEPLGLAEVFHPAREPPRAPRAVSWNGPAGGPFLNFTEMYDGPSFATGLWPLGLVMSARTLAAWGRALFTDFLSPDVRAEMLTAVPDDGAIPHQVAAGVGVRRFDFLGRTQWGHSGTTLGGSSMLLYDEASGIVVALVYNQPGASHDSSHFTLAPRLLSLALEVR